MLYHSQIHSKLLLQISILGSCHKFKVADLQFYYRKNYLLKTPQKIMFFLL